MDRELLYVFGTGNAAVTNLYNTCFALRDGDEYFMMDPVERNLHIIKDL